MACELGSVTDSNEAYVPLGFISGEVIECLIDTGFSGQVVLPRTVVERLGLPFVGCEVFEMFGGHLVTADIVLADVEWLDQQRTVQVIISEGEDALIGTEMLVGTQLTIDYVARTLAVTAPSK